MPTSADPIRKKHLPFGKCFLCYTCQFLLNQASCQVDRDIGVETRDGDISLVSRDIHNVIFITVAEGQGHFEVVHQSTRTERHEEILVAVVDGNAIGGGAV